MSEMVFSMGQVRIEIVFLGFLAGVLLGLCVAVSCRSRIGFASWWAVMTGGLFVVELLREAENRELLFFVALALFLLGVGELLIACSYALQRLTRRKRIRRASAFYQEEERLPAKGNTYVRRRLELAENSNREEREQAGVNLEYIRELLTKLKGAKLAVVERLRVEELSKQLTAYALKEGLTAEERVGLGDCFSAVLALASKYGV